MNRLYTFIMGYDGGTYVSQYKAKNVNRAYNKWARSLLHIKKLKLSQQKVRDIVQEIEDLGLRPVPLKGLSNAWCGGVTIGCKYALVNIVLTHKVQEPWIKIKTRFEKMMERKYGNNKKKIHKKNGCEIKQPKK